MTDLIEQELINHRVQQLSYAPTKFACTCHGPDKYSSCNCVALHQAAVASLKSDLNTAARIGSCLLEQVQNMEQQLKSQEQIFEARLNSLVAENSELLSKNKELTDRAVNVSETLLSHEDRIETLSNKLLEASAMRAKQRSLAIMAETLEKQVLLLESVQRDLREELSASQYTASQYEKKWRAAEALAKQVASEYERLNAGASVVPYIVTVPTMPRIAPKQPAHSTPLRHRSSLPGTTGMLTPDTSMDSPCPKGNMRGMNSDTDLCMSDAGHSLLRDSPPPSVRPLRTQETSVSGVGTGFEGTRNWQSPVAKERSSDISHASGLPISVTADSPRTSTMSTAAKNMRSLLENTSTQTPKAQTTTSRGWLSFRRS